MSDYCTAHFVERAATALQRLTALVEGAAAALDRPGTLRLREKILSETRMAVDCIRAADNSIRGFGSGDAPPTSRLASEVDRLRALSRKRHSRAAIQTTTTRRSHLRIVGGTDMEGTAA